MGGALAQIAAAYYADLSPRLVTFAAPAVGNSEFCRFVDRAVQVINPPPTPLSYPIISINTRLYLPTKLASYLPPTFYVLTNFDVV